MVYSPHGGGCCGYTHYHGVDRSSVEMLDNNLEAHFREPNDNRVFEIILSQRQVQTPPDPADNRFHPSVVEAGGWPNVLAARGFQLGCVWLNSNSGNLCYQFLKTSRWHNGPLPFVWTGGRIEMQTPPEVITRPPTISEGSIVSNDIRDGETIRIGTVISLSGRNCMVRWHQGGEERVPLSGVRVVRVLEERPLPIDPSLPVRVFDRDGNILQDTTMLTRVRPGDQPTDGIIASVGGIAGSGWYHLDTGQYGLRDNRFYIRNVTEVELLPRTQAPAVVLTELFALFRNNTLRGPFDTVEEIRETYPRVTSFITRRIFSDGTSQRETARIPRI